MARQLLRPPLALCCLMEGLGAEKSEAAREQLNEDRK
jgi:hypothetical protein